MKNLILFFAAVVVGIFTMFGAQSLKVKSNSNLDAQFTKTSLFSSDKAPRDSLVGNIVTLSGEVAWQSREATEPAKINSVRLIQQGEELKTATGSATINFENAAKLVISQNSEISFAQTLPANFVFVQNMGTVEYNRLGKIPLSIRVMHLLIDQDLGDIMVSIDEDKQRVIVDVKNGKITAVFNDLEFNSKLFNVSEGKRLIFNDDTREAEVK
ncbi:MAG: hypothetical protein Q8P92_02955 [Candidatus Daviesbacteria bacterium]|nr:hypothetical protein [Candidatus Daviesbacteria bacterium]